MSESSLIRVLTVTPPQPLPFCYVLHPRCRWVAVNIHIKESKKVSTTLLAIFRIIRNGNTFCGGILPRGDYKNQHGLLNTSLKGTYY